MNQRFPGNSFTPSVLARLFYALPNFKNVSVTYEETLERIARKLMKKRLIARFLKLGRENNSPRRFKQAIALGSFSARGELVLLCFNEKLSITERRGAFELVKVGHAFGCPDCSGMLAHIYATGFRGVIARCDETAYRLACASAAAGSLFGKMALAHFLKSLLGVQDPDEETFDLLWTDLFIRDFASPRPDVPIEDVPAEDVPADYEDPFKDWSKSDLEDLFEVERNILMEINKREIAKLLIAEIQQEHARNPNIPKVWLNLPAI